MSFQVSKPKQVGQRLNLSFGLILPPEESSIRRSATISRCPHSARDADNSICTTPRKHVAAPDAANTGLDVATKRVVHSPICYDFQMTDLSATHPSSISQPLWGFCNSGCSKYRPGKFVFKQKAALFDIPMHKFVCRW